MTSGGLVALARPLKGKLFTGAQTPAPVTWGRGNATTDLNFTGKRCHIGDARFHLHMIEECTLRASDSSQKFFLVGNSHANHYREAFYLIAKNHGIDLQALTINWCPFPYSDKFQQWCKSKSQVQIENFIRQNASAGDVVFISNRRMVNHERNNPELEGYDWMTGDRFIEDIDRFISFMPNGVKTVLISPTPEFDRQPELCEPQWFRLIPSEYCSKDNPYIEVPFLRPFTQMNPEVLVYNPSHAVCPNRVCSVFDKDNARIYFDLNHLSDYGNSQYIHPSLLDFIEDYQLINTRSAN